MTGDQEQPPALSGPVERPTIDENPTLPAAPLPGVADTSLPTTTRTADHDPRARLEPAQLAALTAYVTTSGDTAAAAAAAGVSRSTVYRWRSDPAWILALDQELQLAADTARRELQLHVKAAVQRVAHLMQHGGKDDRTQLDAAALLLAHVFGQPARRSVVSGPGGGPIEHSSRSVTVHYDAARPAGRGRGYSTAAAPSASGPGDGSDDGDSLGGGAGG